MKERILLVDDDKRLLSEETAYFNSHPDYDVVGSCTNGKDAIALFDRLRPDAMVLDLVMPVCDGLTVLGEIEKGGCKIIALGNSAMEEYLGDVLKTADYFMLKPFEMSELDKKLKNIRHIKPARVTYSEMKGKVKCDQRISEIFMTVGIPAHIKGYQFLREAVKMAIETPDIINSITKRLYPEVAKKFDTSPSKVERAIRHAIEVAWNKGRIESVNSIFGVKVYSSNEKPTNGEFIALVADKMLLENM